LEKVGGLGDGPKWMCDIDRLAAQVERRRQSAEKQSNYDPDAKRCLIYSIGSNGDYKFEDAVVDTLGQLCEIHVFDVGDFDRGAKNTNRGIIFHKWGLVSSYSSVGNNVTTHTFPEIKKLLGHEGRTLDVFKIDCEGCEWYVLVMLSVVVNLNQSRCSLAHSFALLFSSTGPPTRIGSTPTFDRY
jgi:hypothetical protein